MSAMPILVIECPECGVHVTVALTVTPRDTDEFGDLVLAVDADTADLWAHAWSHERGSS